jgi:hypothetical protein
VKSGKNSGTKKGVKCEVIECETTGDWLWETIYEQFGQMDKYSGRTQHNRGPATTTGIPILYYNYCMMLWISRSQGLGSVTVNNL